MKVSWLQPFLIGVAVGWSLQSFVADISKPNSYKTALSDSISALHVIQKAREDSDGGNDSDNANNGDGGEDSGLKRRDELCGDAPLDTANVHTALKKETYQNETEEVEEEDSMELEEEQIQREQQQQPTSVCSAIHALPSSSPMSIWKTYLIDDKSNIQSIYWASKHYRDNFQAFQDFNSRVLYYMTPQRLQTTIKSIPRNQQLEKVGQILGIAYKRYEYLTQKENGVVFPDDYEEPRKVQIVVMGGSVSLGMFCSQYNPLSVPLTSIHREHCAWPGRLFKFIDHLFPGIVEGHILTIGGMNTHIATELWRYNMGHHANSNQPQEPDILIHAYSTNDIHVLETNKTLEDAMQEMQEKFIRTVLQPRSSCDEREPPLLLFLDDYLGNHQKELRKAMTANYIESRLSTYYGLGFISYADAVRDFVYGDSEEWWFSPKEWPQRDIHPGMGAHISMMYIVAYNLLNMATTYCDRLDIGPEHIYDSSVNGMPELKNSNETLYGEPKPKITNALPPEMTADLSLDDISVQWREAENASIALGFDASECIMSNGTYIPCTLTWAQFIPGVEKSFLATLGKSLVLNDGWEQARNAPHKDLTPETLDTKMKMRFNLTDTVERLNFIVMQSHGEEWEDSRVEVKAAVFRNGEQAVAQSMVMNGFHAKNTSESFNYKMDLGENRALKGDELVVDVNMVGRTEKFLIKGMMFCRL